MTIKRSRSSCLVLAFVCLALALPGVSFAQGDLKGEEAVDNACEPAPPGDVQHTMDKLLSAIEAQDYDAFSALGNQQFKNANPKQQFAEFSRKAHALLDKGYQQHYLGSLTRENMDIYIYKLSYDNATGDSLVMTGFNTAGELSSMLFR